MVCRRFCKNRSNVDLSDISETSRGSNRHHRRCLKHSASKPWSVDRHCGIAVPWHAGSYALPITTDFLWQDHGLGCAFGFPDSAFRSVPAAVSGVLAGESPANATLLGKAHRTGITDPWLWSHSGSGPRRIEKIKQPCSRSGSVGRESFLEMGQ